jgi:hypothetical protein
MASIIATCAGTPMTRCGSYAAGGCAFDVAPDHTVVDEPVFWSPDLDPGGVVIAADVAALTGSPLGDAVNLRRARAATEGLYALCGAGRDAIPVLLTPPVGSGAPTAQLALDAAAPDRIAAVARLWRVIHRRPVPPDARLTPARRRRLAQMLRAVDGRLADASYREIAQVLFGEARVAADPWKTSPLRDAAIRLARDGGRFVDGGYRRLLRRGDPA